MLYLIYNDNVVMTCDHETLLFYGPMSEVILKIYLVYKTRKSKLKLMQIKRNLYRVYTYS